MDYVRNVLPQVAFSYSAAFSQGHNQKEVLFLGSSSNKNCGFGMEMGLFKDNYSFDVPRRRNLDSQFHILSN